jgi:hypothetical protein
MRLNEACANIEAIINSGKKELFSSAYEKILFEIDAIKNAIMKKDY